jgi:RNA polymerase sigma-70 factor (ECF subfamily)
VHEGATAKLIEEAVKEGDASAFEVLLKPLLEPGYRLACGMLHDPAAAEDSVQEASFKAWRKRSQVREGAEMRSWFLAIVANECRTARRSRWWSVIKSTAPAEASATSAADPLTGMQVRRALRALDHPKRLVLVLRWYLDLPIEEIAATTGSSVHAAESRLRRGTEELRRRLAMDESRSG